MADTTSDDAFAEMLHRANAFFTELAANNTREWFETHKARYTDDIRKPAELLADLIAEDLSRHTGLGHVPKVFRIYRDVRFSKDKTPYNTHLHILWSPPGDGAKLNWFMGVSPSYFLLGMGLVGLKGDALTRFRVMIDHDGAAIQEALDALPDVKLSDWGGEPLKRVPKPYAADHPNGDLLRRKSLVINAPMRLDDMSEGVIAGINAHIRRVLPLWQLLKEMY